MIDKFSAYTIDQSLLTQGAIPKPGDKVIVANRYIAPCPFHVYVDHIIEGDQYTDPKAATAHGGIYPLSACFAPNPNEPEPKYIVHYQAPDGLRGTFENYVLPTVLEFVKRNRPFTWWTLYAGETVVDSSD